ncbi:hypothetical protein D104_07405 [Marinomonas profundimaris]|uniref:Uncharacterized protein n=1 Tax=Marinomonas profundimaris TaxID=1208321 RepID=W1RV20_9GAMM|nr:hypothetical protein D104_07405 [Marinomonas profundimaris]
MNTLKIWLLDLFTKNASTQIVKNKMTISFQNHKPIIYSHLKPIEQEYCQKIINTTMRRYVAAKLV